MRRVFWRVKNGVSDACDWGLFISKLSPQLSESHLGGVMSRFDVTHAICTAKPFKLHQFGRTSGIFVAAAE